MSQKQLTTPEKIALIHYYGNIFSQALSSSFGPQRDDLTDYAEHVISLIKSIPKSEYP